jgi:hypothetical protein
MYPSFFEFLYASLPGKMKKYFFGSIILIFVYGAGGVSRDFIRDKIYSPIRDSFINSAASEPVVSYIQVMCPKNGLTLATFGQSNSANSVRPLAPDAKHVNLFQYDWKSGKCYEYKEPLLGTNGDGGNVITHTALKLAQYSLKPVIVAPFGVGGTSVLQWAYGYLSYQHDIVLSNMKRDGINPQVFLWHQGEWDARRDGLIPSDLLSEEKENFWLDEIRIGNDSPLGLLKVSYADALQIILDKTKKYFPESHFGIALVSRCSNRDQWEPVREAQREITQINKDTFISADSDKIYSEVTRYDKCHFSQEGAKQLGRQYFLAITKALK